jgi:hypothetical protein
MMAGSLGLKRRLHGSIKIGPQSILKIATVNTSIKKKNIYGSVLIRVASCQSCVRVALEKRQSSVRVASE